MNPPSPRTHTHISEPLAITWNLFMSNRALLLTLLLLISLTPGLAFRVSAIGHLQQQQQHRKPSGPAGAERFKRRCRRKTFRTMEGVGSTAPAAPAATPSGGAGEVGKDTPLFVYGTLMNNKVLCALLNRVPSTQKARLSGYHRYRILDHVFPAIRPREGGSVDGLLMTGLDAREKLIFDLFEDDDYHKVDVEVKVEAIGDDVRTATCYVWNASAEDQLYGTWDPSTHFTEDGPVPAYVSMVERFSKEIQEEGLLEDAAVDAAVE